MYADMQNAYTSRYRPKNRRDGRTEPWQPSEQQQQQQWKPPRTFPGFEQPTQLSEQQQRQGQAQPLNSALAAQAPVPMQLPLAEQLGGQAIPYEQSVASINQAIATAATPGVTEPTPVAPPGYTLTPIPPGTRPVDDPATASINEALASRYVTDPYGANPFLGQQVTPEGGATLTYGAGARPLGPGDLGYMAPIVGGPIPIWQPGQQIEGGPAHGGSSGTAAAAAAEAAAAAAAATPAAPAAPGTSPVGASTGGKETHNYPVGTNPFGTIFTPPTTPASPTPTTPSPGPGYVWSGWSWVAPIMGASGAASAAPEPQGGQGGQGELTNPAQQPSTPPAPGMFWWWTGSQWIQQPYGQSPVGTAGAETGR